MKLNNCHLEETIIRVNDLEEIDVKTIYRKMETHSVVALRGLINPAEVRKCLNNIKARFDIKNDRKRGPGEYDLIKANYQRMLAGCTGGAPGYTNPRLYRVFYNPLWEEDIYQMHGLFKHMVKFRNRMSFLPDDFAIDKEERGLWTASRIQHYPSGGGFLVPHTDIAVHRSTQNAGIEKTVNSVLIMTKRGQDFQEGGGYVEIGGDKIFFEDVYEVGDLVIYDEFLVHGVDDIDPLMPLDLTSPNGRYTGFVTLFAS